MSDQTNDPITAKFGDRQPPNSPEAQIQRIDDRIRELDMWAGRAIEDLTARVDKLQERFDHRDDSFHKHLVYLEKRDAILAHLESETDRLCHRVRELEGRTRELQPPDAVREDRARNIIVHEVEKLRAENEALEQRVRELEVAEASAGGGDTRSMDELTNTDDFRGMMAGLGGGRRDKKDSESSKPESAKAHSGREEPADDAHERLHLRLYRVSCNVQERESDLSAILVSPATWKILFPGKRGPHYIGGLPVCIVRGLPDAESAELHDILAASFLVRHDSPLLWLVKLDTTEQLMQRVYNDAVPWFAKEETAT